MHFIMKKEIGIVGLGKMGMGIAKQLHEKGWRVIVRNRTASKVDEAAAYGMSASYSYQEMISKFESQPRIIWLMLPAGAPIEEALFGNQGLSDYLQEGDIVVEAGNSFYKEDPPRAQKLAAKGVGYIDVGVSGGPSGARNGACLMVGGSREDFQHMEDLYKDISVPDGYAHFAGVGAGHFVKMVHNGIEYGMMQAIGEGFNVMKKSEFHLDLTEVARIYDTGSVIESRLVEWLQKAYTEWGEDLKTISGTISHSGEGKWTVETAEEMGEEVPVIADAYQFRLDSERKPSYIGQVVSALRGQFGGHPVKK